MTLITTKPRLRFSELFVEASSRSEVICTFLALLELIRLKQLVCEQPENFGEIEITRRAPAEPAASPDASTLEPGAAETTAEPASPSTSVPETETKA